MFLNTTQSSVHPLPEKYSPNSQIQQISLPRQILMCISWDCLVWCAEREFIKILLRVSHISEILSNYIPRYDNLQFKPPKAYQQKTLNVIKSFLWVIILFRKQFFYFQSWEEPCTIFHSDLQTWKFLTSFLWWYCLTIISHDTFDNWVIT